MGWAALSRAGLGVGPVPCLCFEVQVLNFQKTQRLSPGYVDALTSPLHLPLCTQSSYAPPGLCPPVQLLGAGEKALSSQGAKAGTEHPQGDQLLCVAL